MGMYGFFLEDPLILLPFYRFQLFQKFLTKLKYYRWSIFRDRSRVGSIQEGWALVLDIVDLDQDVGS
jgi:hypothetical protein